MVASLGRGGGCAAWTLVLFSLLAAGSARKGSKRYKARLPQSAVASLDTHPETRAELFPSLFTAAECDKVTAPHLLLRAADSSCRRSCLSPKAATPSPLRPACSPSPPWRARVV